MIDTPRTDEAEKHAYEFKDEYTPVCESKFVRQLERELNAANQRIDMLTACNADVARIAKERDDALNRIKRLEEALDTLTLVVGLTPIVGNKDVLQEAMDMARAELKAKEDKP